ncbi:F-box protein At5g03970-like [Humulus lupulus]|uniref:F-box protein At5g03970-like n=1 Tax=Humulus lupulus TaxID=3486 RepID=UPI002B4051A3|nr:F-box protein At5g03970-like [Humulus lupulus]
MDGEERARQFLLRSSNSKIFMSLKDIIKEYALPYLPAKTLCKFKTVCKDWKLHISTPFFVHTQSNNFQQISGFFCQSKSDPPFFVSLPNTTSTSCYGVPDPSLSFLPEPVELRASSNGLLCCQGHPNLGGYYYICNPATKQWKKLPKPTAPHGSDPALALVFEPHLLNFTADYKLVCAFPCDRDSNQGYEFHIYSSAQGSWRVSSEMYLGRKKLLPRSGVHVNGVIYWRTTCCRVFLFDLVKERTHYLDGNYYGYYDDDYGGAWILGDMNRQLCSAKNSEEGVALSVLSNAYSSSNTIGTWTVKRYISFRTLCIGREKSPPFFILGNFDIRVIFSDGKWLLFTRGTELCLWDIKSKECSKLLAAGVDSHTRIVAYVNSLVHV